MAKGKQVDWTKYTNVGGMWINLDYYYDNISSRDANGCANWVGPKHRQNYGMMGGFNASQKRIMTVVHRITARLKYGRDLGDRKSTRLNPVTATSRMPSSA